MPEPELRLQRARLLRASRQISSQRWREQGFIQLAVLGTMALSAGALIALGTAGFHIQKTIVVYTATRSAYSTSENWEERLKAEAPAAKAIITNATAVDGQPNCDSSGNCREIDLYGGFSAVDGQHASFVAYLATPSGGVQRYTYTETTGGVPTGVKADGAALPGVKLFFREVPVTSFLTDPDVSAATKAQLARVGATAADLKRWTFQYEHQGVVASNDVFYVHYDPGTGTDVFGVSVGVKPLKSFTLSSKIYGAAPPPPIDTPSGFVGAFLFFPTASSPSQSFNVHELNFHDAFTLLGACTSGGSSIASAGPGSQFPNPNPLVPANQDSGPATFSVSPQTAGVCNQFVQDSYGQAASVGVDVAGPLYGTSSLRFNSPSAGAQNLTVAKTYDPQDIAASFSGCGGIVNVGAPAFATSPYGSAGPTQETVGITPVGAGSCTMSTTDQYGESVSTSIVVLGNLSVSPSTLSFANGSSSPAQQFYVSESAYNGSFNVNMGSCGGSFASSLASGGGGGPNSSYNVTANSGSASCSAVISDDHGGSGVVSLIVSSPATPPPVTPPPATPTPAGGGGATPTPPSGGGATPSPPPAGALNPGSCYTSGATTSSLDIFCSSPSGGTGINYGAQIHTSGQGPTVICNWAAAPGFACTVSGLSPSTSYSASPLFGDSAATHVWGPDFSGTTLAISGGGGATPAPPAALNPGTCYTSGATLTSLDITCTSPSGGTGINYGVQIHNSGQGPTVLCNWTAAPGFACTVSGLSPSTSYSASPLFGDSASTHVWGPDFSGTTLAMSVTPSPVPTPPVSIPCTLDAYGYCMFHTGPATDNTVMNRILCPPYLHYQTGTKTDKFDLYNSQGFVDHYLVTTTFYIYNPCAGETANNSTGWSPFEPSVYANDPLLPSNSSQVLP